MRTALDPARHVGHLRIATISQTATTGHTLGGGVFVSVSKRPLALLILQDDTLAGYATSGQRLSYAEIEALCPGAIAAFEEAER